MKEKKFAALAISILFILSFLLSGLYSQVIERGHSWFSCYKAPTKQDPRGCRWDSGCYGDDYKYTTKCKIQCYNFIYDSEGNKTDRTEKAGSGNCGDSEAEGGGWDEWDDGGFWEWWFFCI
jgi:hypothetical protein